MPASSSLIGRRRMSRNSVGMVGLKPKTHVWRMSPPPRKFQLLSEVQDNRRFLSDKARIRETLDSKQMESLKIGLEDFKPRGLPTPPSSLVNTPTELYGMRTDESGKSSIRGSTPLPKAKQHALPLSPDVERLKMRKSMALDVTRKPTERPVYIPGPIELEEKITWTPRRGSIAIMERFDDGTIPEAKRFSDLVALEGIVMYFQALGVAEEASEACLDRYWVPKRRSGRPISGLRSLRKAAPPPLTLPLSTGSLFRSKKASRDEDESPSSPGSPSRQKSGLRQFLKSSRSIL
ncbi:hypothetical protein N0V90_012640 [Kalmusia sp. IMI 367209]|nr:hypothetical protein N0V90_012640 [Kalmusia sp. IMI 367209]